MPHSGARRKAVAWRGPAMHKSAPMGGPRILLVIGGGIAAYKACELVRLIRKEGAEVVCVLTAGGAQFVTAMSLAALSENAVYTSLWDLKDEVEMGHIQLSRAADLVVVCPATADLMARMANGVADDLATTLLLATDKPVLAVPAMNVRMWEHSATRRNVARLRAAGITVLEPDEGPMACGEFGAGRLPEPPAIMVAIAALLTTIAVAPRLPGLEPEPRTEADSGLGESGLGESGLGGLTAGLIARRPREPGDDAVEAELLAASGEPESELDSESPNPELPDPESANPEPVSPTASPLVSKKGKAKPAPPTDPDAIPSAERHALHLQDASVPEALADPLEGQPDFAEGRPRPLHGIHVLITAGPTHEPIDPVRYIANRSSGRQGFAIAAAAAAAGARVTLVSGPVALPTPRGVERIDVETAREMAAAVNAALPADAAIMVAAVADWRSKDTAGQKMKKRGSAPPALLLAENPDILAGLASGRKRPRLLVGFAAETENVIPNAQDKLRRKAVDWIVANDVSGGKGKSVMGGELNRVHIVTSSGVESWDDLPKDEVARRLIEKVADVFTKVG